MTAGSTEASPASGGLWPAHTLADAALRSDSQRSQIHRGQAFSRCSVLPPLARTVVHVCVDSGTPGQTHGTRLEQSVRVRTRVTGRFGRSHEGKARTSCSVTASPWDREFVCLLRAAFISCGEFTSVCSWPEIYLQWIVAMLGMRAFTHSILPPTICRIRSTCGAAYIT